MNASEAILTERLRLRPPTLEDAEQIFAQYGQDARVCRYMSWTPHRTVEDTHAFLGRIVPENEAGRSLGFLIFSRETDELLGSVGGAINNHRMQFGYLLTQDAGGHGFATEAARAFIGAAFTFPAISRVQAYCDIENVASARVLEKAGLTREGILRCFLKLPNLGDSPRDIFLYAKLRDGAVASE